MVCQTNKNNLSPYLNLDVSKLQIPIKGQQVPVGKNLTVSGISKYNLTSSCRVFIIINSIWPYQKTLPMGQTRGDDYSKWTYSLVSTSPWTIKEGVNKVTAKLLCQPNPTTETKFYSINITGLNEPISKQQHFAIESNNTAMPFLFGPLCNLLILTV